MSDSFIMATGTLSSQQSLSSFDHLSTTSHISSDPMQPSNNNIFHDDSNPPITSLVSSKGPHKPRPYLSHTVSPGNSLAQPHRSLTSLQISKHVHHSVAPSVSSTSSFESSDNNSVYFPCSQDNDNIPPIIPSPNTFPDPSQSIPIVTMPNKENKTEFIETNNKVLSGPINKDLQATPPCTKKSKNHVSVPRNRHVSYTEDSLTVDLMKLPRTQHYSTAPPPAKPVVLIQVPPMRDVWLDDDDEYSDSSSDENTLSSHLSFGLRRHKKHDSKTSVHHMLNSQGEQLSRILTTTPNSEKKKHGRLRHSLQITKAFDGMSGSTGNTVDSNNARSWKNLRFSWASTANPNNNTNSNNNQPNPDNSIHSSKASPSSSSSTAVSKSSARASIVSLSSSTTSSSSCSPVNLSYQSPSLSLTSSPTRQSSRSSPNICLNVNNVRPPSFVEVATCKEISPNTSVTSNNTDQSKSASSLEATANRLTSVSSPQTLAVSTPASSSHSRRQSRSSTKLFGFLNSKSPKSALSSTSSPVPVSEGRHRKKSISSPTNFVHTAHVDSLYVNGLPGIHEFTSGRLSKTNTCTSSFVADEERLDEYDGIDAQAFDTQLLMSLSTCQGNPDTNRDDYDTSNDNERNNSLLPALELKGDE